MIASPTLISKSTAKLMHAELIRQLAAEVRKEAAELEQRKMEKCAHVLEAAKALLLLRSKVTSNVR
jgi:hypothetical protein